MLQDADCDSDTFPWLEEKFVSSCQAGLGKREILSADIQGASTIDR
jgi:hypothetical protein